MTIHDVEADTGDGVVRTLLAGWRTELSSATLTPLHTTGTSNALWRVDSHDGRVVARLPRTEGSESGLVKEVDLLPRLGRSALADVVAVPTVLHAGQPSDVFPYAWSVLDWLDGEDLWTVRSTVDEDDSDLATQLAAIVRTIGDLDDIPVEYRRPGQRGGPLDALLDRLLRWLDDPQWSAADLIDVDAVRRLVASAAGLVDHPQMRFSHGDLIPGNLLRSDGRVSAVIDWGSAGFADPAQDLAPAWSILGRRGREIFCRELDVDDATWARARLTELEHAVGAVLYYVPRGHALGTLMQRTLERILDEGDTTGA